MAERSTSRRSARGGKKSSDNGKNAKTPEPENSVEMNRAKVRLRLEELTLPILEKFGQPAFDELHSRLEVVIREYTIEVEGLFSDLVGQAKLEHERLMGLLKRDETEGDGDSPDPVLADDEDLSDIERRLEGMDQKEGASGGDSSDGYTTKSAGDEDED